MTNSDYLLRAAIKKVSEKLNELLAEKIEEAANIAQDAPEKIKKEFDILRDSIIEEAERMERKVNTKENATQTKNQDIEITSALEEIEQINQKIELLNQKINN